MEKEYGVVFAGGGTKGSYQVGVIKALKKLNIKVKAVAGASIGSINAAMFVQDDIELLEDLYKNITMQDIIKLSDKNDLDSDANIFDIKNIGKIISGYFSKEGISNQPLRELLEKYIDIDKIKKSKIDFGFMTYDVDNKTGKKIWKEEIDQDKMIDYLLASSCFPIFRPQVVEGKSYLDGGLSDNLPISMLEEKGCKDIIIIDIKGVGKIKRNHNKDINFTIIRPNESLGGLFDFDKENILKNIELGYLDTLKTFHKLIGNHYYFKKEEYFKLLGEFTLEEIEGLEEAALVYKINKYTIYSSAGFKKELIDCYNKEKEYYKKIDKDITNLKNIKDLIEEGYIFTLLDDLISNYPSLLTSYKGIFSKYINASESMDILLREH